MRYHCRKPAAAAVQLRVEALQLLAHFLSLPADQLTVLSETVSELVTDVFPASSWEWKRGSTQSTDYARQLMALMDSVVAAAEQGRPVQAMLQVCCWPAKSCHWFCCMACMTQAAWAIWRNIQMNSSNLCSLPEQLLCKSSIVQRDM